MDCGDAKKEFGSANSLGILLKMQGATHGWIYMEEFDETNVPGRMHGACDSVAGENDLCDTVTRKAGDIIGASCGEALANEMTGFNTMTGIASEDGAPAVNNGLEEGLILPSGNEILAMTE